MADVESNTFLRRHLFVAVRRGGVATVAEYLRNPQWIEAWQVTETNAEELAAMLGLRVNYQAGTPTGAVEFRYWDHRFHDEGVCNVHPGDYIFRLPGGPFDKMYKEGFEASYTEINPHD